MSVSILFVQKKRKKKGIKKKDKNRYRISFEAISRDHEADREPLNPIANTGYRRGSRNPNFVSTLIPKSS